MARPTTSVDVGVLVDILSNVAGMMILLACVALLVKQSPRPPARGNQPSAKPIAYPLAYLPNKRPVTFCLKFGRFYELPERALLDEVIARARQGQPIASLELDHQGVHAAIAVAPTATGYSFLYRLDPAGGLPLSDKRRLRATLDRLVAQFPPERFFFMLNVWPDGFAEFRDVREYLLEKKVEVGWAPRDDRDDDGVDLVYAVGLYDENFTSIKAQ